LKQKNCGLIKKTKNKKTKNKKTKKTKTNREYRKQAVSGTLIYQISERCSRVAGALCAPGAALVGKNIKEVFR
jgi:hypothetical protein